MYSAMLLEHFENPRNIGEVCEPTVASRVENPVCGDVLELSMRIDGGVMADARFRAKGCVPAIACGSALTQLLIGRTLNEALTLKIEDVITSLGGIPGTSTHAAALAIEALQKALTRVGAAHT